MDTLVWLLPLATFLIVIGFALWNKRRIERLDHSDPRERSSLATDGPGPKPVRGPDPDS